MLPSLLLAAVVAAPPASGSPPRLGVLVVVDQLGSADLETMALLGEADFGGLEARGAARFDALYDNLATETGPGHATLSTGASPSTHGICANDWFVGAAPTYCVTDPATTLMGSKTPGKSARFLEAPTLGDTLKTRSPRSKVVAVSLKDRASILMGGPSADVAIWYEPSLGRFTSSTAYGPQLPPWAEKLAGLPERAQESGTWSPLPQGLARQVPDLRAGEASPDGFGPAFPHDLKALPVKQRAKAYRLSPHSMEDVFQLARAALEGERLGQRGVPDLLLISISTTDYVGHNWGPGSAEKVDVMERTSVQLKRFLAVLDARLGRSGWVMALSSDHGAAPLVEQSQLLRLKAGRVTPRALLAAATTGLKPELVSRVLGFVPPHAFLNEEGLSAAERGQLRDHVQSAILQVPGVRAAPEALARRTNYQTRCGSVLFDFAPHFVFTDTDFNAGTDHASSNLYDRRVPLYLLGPGVAPGRRHPPVRTVDAAPSLASLLGIPPPDLSEGTPLIP